MSVRLRSLCHHHCHTLRYPTSARFSTKRVPIPIPFDTHVQPSIRIPITERCPPSCSCSLEPVPPDLDIDKTTPLQGTMANYYRHLLVCTGRSDWAPRIEMDTSEPGGGLAGRLRELTALRGGRKDLRDPFAPTLITNSSFEREKGIQGGCASAYVFPDGVYLPEIPLRTDGIVGLIKNFLLPQGPTDTPEWEHGSRRVEEAVILICSHRSRDNRCGQMSAPLKRQFEKEMEKKGLLLRDGVGRRGGVRVGFTSHLSGHKFAGNVVVYLPGGLGIWYGRVEPKHVTGILEETVIGGRVIRELCRGAVGVEGSISNLGT